MGVDRGRLTADVAGLALLARRRLVHLRRVLGLPRLRLDGLRPPDDLGRRVQQLEHALPATQARVRHAQQAHAEAQPVQAPVEHACVHAHGPDAPVLAQLAPHLVRDSAQLQVADAAEVVDLQHDLVVLLELDIVPIGIVRVKQLGEHLLDDAGEVGL